MLGPQAQSRVQPNLLRLRFVHVLKEGKSTKKDSSFFFYKDLFYVAVKEDIHA